jgi:hypothetical protein
MMHRSLLAGALALAAVAPAVVGCTSPHPASIAKGGVALPFIENDYAQALVRARDENLPLFVEVWAPW